MTFPIHLTKVFAEVFWKCMADLQDPERRGNILFMRAAAAAYWMFVQAHSTAVSTQRNLHKLPCFS